MKTEKEILQRINNLNNEISAIKREINSVYGKSGINPKISFENIKTNNSDLLTLKSLHEKKIRILKWVLKNE